MLVAFNSKGTFLIMWPSQTSLCHKHLNTFFIGLLIGMEMAVSAALEMKSSTSSAPLGGLHGEDTRPDWRQEWPRSDHCSHSLPWHPPPGAESPLRQRGCFRFGGSLNN